MEIIKLNLIPSGVNPTCHCSQYDEGRVIRIELFDGLTPYTLQSGDTVTLNVRKPDNTIVTTTVETTQGNNYVDIVTTEQICACVGYNLCDLTLTNGSKVIGTLNFIMAIERDVLADGIESQSVIEDLDERVAEVVGDNYYTKEETEELIDNELKDVYPLGEASGAIASFNTDVILPLKYLTAEINATETGSGEKSPSNPYTINSFSQADITVTNNDQITNLYTIVFGQTIYGGRLIYDNGQWSIEAKKKGIDLGSLDWSAAGDDGLHNSSNITDMKPAHYSTVLSDYMCEVATPKVAGSGWTSMHEGEFGINSRALRIKWSAVTSGDDFKSLVNGKYFVYPLETPVIIPITSDTRVKTVFGENYIFTNTNGDIDVLYHHALTAKNIYFDNSGTELQADNVEDAIKEILTLIQGGNNSRALNLSKGSLKVEAPVSNEKPTVEEDPITEEETATEEPVKAEELTTEEEPEEISENENEPTSDEER